MKIILASILLVVLLGLAAIKLSSVTPEFKNHKPHAAPWYGPAIEGKHRL